MKVSRSRLIVDTNVLIDLHSGGIVEQFFALPYEFVSPDVIIEESEEPDGKELERQGLIRAELSSDGVLEVEFLWEHNLEIAVNDIFALVLASHEALPLLTGDRRLRNLADKHRVPVHGTLWVLDEMVKHNVLTKGQAAHALQLMLDKNSRLPPSECTHRFRLWEGK
jgi:predicted nucleic acid-binding protein